MEENNEMHWLELPNKEIKKNLRLDCTDQNKHESNQLRDPINYKINEEKQIQQPKLIWKDNDIENQSHQEQARNQRNIHFMKKKNKRKTIIDMKADCDSSSFKKDSS